MFLSLLWIQAMLAKAPTWMGDRNIFLVVSWFFFFNLDKFQFKHSYVH